MINLEYQDGLRKARAILARLYATERGKFLRLPLGPVTFEKGHIIKGLGIEWLIREMTHSEIVLLNGETSKEWRGAWEDLILSPGFIRALDANTLLIT
jgi:hypothetical protein